MIVKMNLLIVKVVMRVGFRFKFYLVMFMLVRMVSSMFINVLLVMMFDVKSMFGCNFRLVSFSDWVVLVIR